MHIPQEEWKKLSHQQRRALINKERRRSRRQLAAQRKKEEEAALESDPTYLEKLAEEEQLAEKKARQEEAQRLLQEELWVERERRAQEDFRRKKELEERVLREREERERLIREEWEALERREREAEERRQKIRREKEDRLKEALSTEEKPMTEEPRHNPLAPDDGTNYGTEKDSVNCAFYLKTGACRFGERCSRNHPHLTSSTTLLIRGMYSSMGLSELMLDERDQDVALEYDEGEMYQHFKEFYEDSLPEFSKAGKVIQFKVSCNYEPHLRGNVYVQYTTEEECAEAYKLFNGRWYAQKQLSCEFCPVQKWKTAICGLFDRRRCPKGKHCNFLHVFRNPGGAFSRANHDMPPVSPPSRRRPSGSWSYRHDSRRRSRSRERRRSRDRSLSPRRYRSWRSRSRSRSRERYDRKHRGRDRRGWKDRRHSNRSRSRSRSRSRERARRSRSRSSSPLDSVSHSSKNQTSKSVRSRSKSPSNDSTKRRKTADSDETKKHRKRKSSHKHKRKRKHQEDIGSETLERKTEPAELAGENEGREHEEKTVLSEELKDSIVEETLTKPGRVTDLEEPGRNAEQGHSLVEKQVSTQTDTNECV